MKKTLAVASLGMFAAPVLALSPPALPVWSIQEGKLLDPNGSPFVFRGVTIDHTLAPEKTVQALKDIAALGANSAQIEFALQYDGNYPRQIIAQIREIIQTCKDSKLVCVLEPNDGSGYSDVSGAVSPSVMASFWGWNDMREVLIGAQSHIIIGLSNQPLGSLYYNSFDYRIRMEQYLYELRSALPFGFIVMIDGNKWGQDTDNAMMDFARINKQENRYPNLIYSIDMFDAYTDPKSARDYIASFAQIGAPLMIGGFGPAPYYHPHNNGPRPAVALSLPAQAIMQYAEEFGVGYFAWSWSGNENSALDLVTNWNSQALTPWGNLAVNDASGIKATAKRASIFSSTDSSSSSSSSSSSANQPPQAVVDGRVVYERCDYVYAKLSAEQSSDPDGDTLTYEWAMSSNFSSSVIYFSGPTLMYNGMRPVTNYLFTLTVTDGKGGTSTATKTLSHAYSDYCVSSSASSSSSIIRPSSSSVMTSRSSISSSNSSSSIRPSSASLSSRSSSSSAATAVCNYVVNSQWNNGFTAAIRVKNTSAQPINGWNVNWQYSDGSKITNLWNASLTGSNPYNAKNLNWNSTIQPGQTVEFGFQGSKVAGAASVPVVSGGVCQ